MTSNVNVVDLFCGCGGLSLGFELFSGDVKYETVMALDNMRQAVRCFNTNDLHNVGRVRTARLSDLTWFSSADEVRLFYLTHFALHQPDDLLLVSLERAGLHRFLSEVRSADQAATAAMANLAGEEDYQEEFAQMDAGVLALAITRGYLAKLGLSGLRTPAPADMLPWAEEAAILGGDGARDQAAPPAPVDTRHAAEFWELELAKLRTSSVKSGRGQHEVVPERLRQLADFIDGAPARRLQKIWNTWRSQRDAARATFIETSAAPARELYAGARKVRLLLGGPPCKGFSRIGRAVIESLRDQGAYAWASEEYGDERNALLHKYVLFLEALQPDVFVFENVAHFASALRTPAGQLDAAAMLEESIATLSSDKLKFHVASRIVRAREHAVPQDRDRFIMVGANLATTPAAVADVAFETRTYTTEVSLHTALLGLAAPGQFGQGNRSAGGCGTDYEVDAFTLLDERQPPPVVAFVSWVRQPKPGTGGAPETVDAHVVRQLRSDDAALLQRFGPGQRWMDYKLKGSKTVAELRAVLERVLGAGAAFEDLFSGKKTRQDLEALLARVDDGLLLRLMMEADDDLLAGTENHLLNGAYLRKGTDAHGDWFERLGAGRPCKTVVAHIGKDTYGYFHPFEARALSIREAARVQSFPDFFKFGSVGVVDGYAIIGNAVPPLLAHGFAERLAKTFFSPRAVIPRVKSTADSVKRGKRRVRTVL